MAISGVTNSLSQTQAFQSLFKVNQVSSQAGGQDADGDSDGSSGAKVGKAGKGSSPLVSSLLSALQQLGANIATPPVGSASSNSTSTGASTADPKQALGDFIKSLMTALQAEANKSTATSAVAPSANKLETGLQNLITDLTAQSTVQSSASPAANGTNAINAALQNLQQSATHLFAATGVPTNSSNLTTLLQSLQESVLGGSATGNFVNSIA